MLSSRSPLQSSRHIYTESERMEKDTPCKRKSEETRSNNTLIRQTDFKIRTVIKNKDTT